jgi:ABC-type uncharacterized transport system fused permease/ATPase subunit
MWRWWCRGKSLSDLYSNVTKPLFDIVLFSRKLSELVGVQGPLSVLLYYFLSGFVIKLISPSFGKLTAEAQRLEGQFRYCHNRYAPPLCALPSALCPLLCARRCVCASLALFFRWLISMLWSWFGAVCSPLPSLIRCAAASVIRHPSSTTNALSLITHSEEVAFYGGHVREKNILTDHFTHICSHMDVFYRKLFYQGIFDGFLVKYGAVMLGYGVLGLPVFGPNSEEYAAKVGDDAAMITHDYIRNSSLLINLARAIGRIVTSYKELQKLAGYAALLLRCCCAAAALLLRPFVSMTFSCQRLWFAPTDTRRWFQSCRTF